MKNEEFNKKQLEQKLKLQEEIIQKKQKNEFILKNV